MFKVNDYRLNTVQLVYLICSNIFEIAETLNSLLIFYLVFVLFSLAGKRFSNFFLDHAHVFENLPPKNGTEKTV